MRLGPQPGSRLVTWALSPREAFEPAGRARATLRQDDALRWPLARMPLGVLIEAPSGPLSAESAFTLLAAALRQWEAAGEGRLRFKPLPDSDRGLSPTADIAIQWNHDTTPGRDFEVGHTHRTLANNASGLMSITQATITLITQPRIDRHLIPHQQQERLLSTFLHEIGHALGLEHSPNPEDVMHHRGWRNSRLSRNDIHRLRLLYAEA